MRLGIWLKSLGSSFGTLWVVNMLTAAVVWRRLARSLLLVIVGECSLCGVLLYPVAGALISAEFRLFQILLPEVEELNIFYDKEGYI